MNRLILSLLTFVMAVVLTSCQDYETYGDMKAQERDAIDRYITTNNIRVISETQFTAQGQTTNVADNEYVRLDRSGVYMQIVRKGCGTPLENNKLVNVLCRFSEYNIKADTLLIFNDHQAFFYLSTLGQSIDVSQYVDKMSVTRSGTSFTASFVSGMMMRYHNSTSVPAGFRSTILTSVDRSLLRMKLPRCASLFPIRRVLPTLRRAFILVITRLLTFVRSSRNCKM